MQIKRVKHNRLDNNFVFTEPEKESSVPNFQFFIASKKGIEYMLKYMNQKDVQYLIKLEDKNIQNEKINWLKAIGKKIASQQNQQN